MLTTSFFRPAAALAVALTCLAASAATHATHSWGGYHWARTTPQFTLKIGNNLTSSDWKAHLAQTSSDWNSPTLFGAASTPLLTAIVAGSSKRCSMIAGTTQVCNAKYGNTGWLGLASINVVGEHITQGSAKMNDTYFSTATYNNPNQRRHVMCQEIAHTFGLDHQSTDGSSQNSCMDYFSNTGSNASSTLSTTPNAHDFEQLNLLYSALDSSTTAAATASLAALDSDVNDDPSSWGHLVRQSENGRSSVYKRYNRNGSETITHVYWTLEAAAACPSCDHRYGH